MKKSFRTYACILAAVMGHMLSAAEPSGFTIRGNIYHKTDKGVEPVDMAVVSVPESQSAAARTCRRILVAKRTVGKSATHRTFIGLCAGRHDDQRLADRTLNFVMKADNFRLDE